MMDDEEYPTGEFPELSAETVNEVRRTRSGSFHTSSYPQWEVANGGPGIIEGLISQEL